MPFVELVALALALAMDAFAVAVASGVTLRRVSRRQTFRLAWHFGLFQASMPIIGWAAAIRVQAFIADLDHWVAFGLLSLLGGRMLLGAIRDTSHPANSDPPPTPTEPTRGWSLVLLSVATSIDALAVGLSLGMLRVPVWFPALIIGLVACALTALGLHLGAYVGRRLPIERWANLLGGAILILIGLHILHAHGVF